MFTHSLIDLVVTAPLLVAGALLDPPLRTVLWGASAVIQIAMPRFFRTRMVNAHYDCGHIVERFGLLVIIALGETIVAIGEPLTDLHLDAAELTVFGAAFALVVSIWWLYFHHSGALLERRLETAETPVDVVRSTISYLHLVVIGGVIATAAGIHEALAEPHEHLHPLFTALLSAGLVLPCLAFLVTRWTTFRRLYVSRFVAAGAALVLVPVGTLLPAVGTMVIMAGIGVGLGLWETLAPRGAGVPGESDFTPQN